MKHSKSALFLMELIVALLFFALASTVCIRLFAKAHLLSEQTVNENHAIVHAQNLAEGFLATEGDIMQMKALFPNAASTSPENDILLLFDEEWNFCDAANACYSAHLTSYPEKDGLITADITIAACNTSADAIYSLKISHHIPERRSNLEQ